MKKKALSILLCAIIALALLTITAAAEEDATVTIGGVTLDAGDYYVNGENGAPGTVTATEPMAGWNARFYFDSANSDAPTLELNGLNVVYEGNEVRDYYGIKIANSITLTLYNTNTVSVGYSGIELSIQTIGVKVDGDLTVRGAGSLTAAVTDNCYGSSVGLYIEGALSVSSGSVTGKNVSGVADNGVFAGSIAVSGTGSVIGVSSKTGTYNGTAAIKAVDNITVSGNGRLEGDSTNTDAPGTYQSGIGIRCDGDIAVSGGTLLARSGNYRALRANTFTSDIPVLADTGYDGAGLAEYVADNNNTYKYVIAKNAPVSIAGQLMSDGDYYVNGTGGAPGSVSATEPSEWNARLYIDETDPDEPILTLELNGLVLTNYNGQYGIYAPFFFNHSTNDLTLVLKGDSRVSTSYADNSESAGLYVNYPSFTVKGDGSLAAAALDNVWNYDRVGIDAQALTMESGSLSGTGSSYGIYCQVTFNLKDGEVTAVGNNYAALYANAVNISGGSIVADGGDGDAPVAGIKAEFYRAISGGKVEAKGVRYGIQSSTDDNITISGGNVLAAGGIQALYAIDGDVLIDYPEPGYVAYYSADMTGIITAKTNSYTYDSSHKYLRVVPNLPPDGTLPGGGTVGYSVNLGSDIGSATVFIAQYDSGRLVNVRAYPVTGKAEGNHTFSTASGKSYTYKLFLLDDNHAPLGVAVLAK